MERKMDVKKMEETLRATAIKKATDAAIAVATALETGCTGTARKTAVSKATEAAKARSAVISTGAKHKEVAKSRGNNSKYKPKNVAIASEAAEKPTTSTTEQSTPITESAMRKIRAAKSTPTRVKYTKTTETKAVAGMPKTASEETITAKPEGAVAAATASAPTPTPAPAPTAAVVGPSATNSCEENIEVDILTDGKGSINRWRSCEKNPGHTKFIQASKFSMKHLPKAYRKEIYLKGIRDIARLTVKLRVNYISTARPDSDSRARFRGQKILTIGTGLVRGFSYSAERCAKEADCFSNLLYDRNQFEIDTGGYDIPGHMQFKIDADSFKRAYGSISPEKCLQMIKSLRAKQGLNGTDNGFGMDDEDEDTPDTDEEILLAYEEDIMTEAFGETDSDDDEGLTEVKPNLANGDFNFDIVLDDEEDLNGIGDDFDMDEVEDLNVTDYFFDIDDEEEDTADEAGEKLLACEEDVTDGLDETDSDDETENNDNDHDGTTDSDDEIQDDDIFNEFSKLNDTKETVTVKPCPCPECVECKTPKPIGYYINIVTARQVVYDSEEARHTVADLFYHDENENNIKHVYGLRSCIISGEGEWSVIACVTHDYTLVRKLRRHVNTMIRRVQRMHKQSTSALAVICSHPHGNVKQISLGPWTHRKLFARVRPCIGTCYGYEAPTCPGSSGAAVLLLGCRPGTRVLESDFHPHLGTAADSSAFPTGLNMSGRARSEDRPLSKLTDSVVAKVLREYEDIVRKERNILRKKTVDLTVVPHRTERLQDYIKYLSKKKMGSAKWK